MIEGNRAIFPFAIGRYPNDTIKKEESKEIADAGMLESDQKADKWIQEMTNDIEKWLTSAIRLRKIADAEILEEDKRIQKTINDAKKWLDAGMLEEDKWIQEMINDREKWLDAGMLEGDKWMQETMNDTEKWLTSAISLRKIADAEMLEDEQNADKRIQEMANDIKQFLTSAIRLEGLTKLRIRAKNIKWLPKEWINDMNKKMKDMHMFRIIAEKIKQMATIPREDRKYLLNLLLDHAKDARKFIENKIIEVESKEMICEIEELITDLKRLVGANDGVEKWKERINDIEWRSNELRNNILLEINDAQECVKHMTERIESLKLNIYRVNLEKQLESIKKTKESLQKIIKMIEEMEKEGQLKLLYGFQLIIGAPRLNIFDLDDNGENNKFKLLAYGIIALIAINFNPIAQFRVISYILSNTETLISNQQSYNKDIKTSLILATIFFALCATTYLSGQILYLIVGIAIVGIALATTIDRILIYLINSIEELKYNGKKIEGYFGIAEKEGDLLAMLGMAAMITIGAIVACSSICVLQGLTVATCISKIINPISIANVKLVTNTISDIVGISPVTQIAIIMMTMLIIWRSLLVNNKNVKVASLGFISALLKAISTAAIIAFIYLISYARGFLIKAIKDFGILYYFRGITFLLLPIFLLSYEKIKIRMALFNKGALLRLVALVVIASLISLLYTTQAASMLIYLPTIISMIANFNISSISLKEQINYWVIAIIPAAICLFAIHSLLLPMPMIIMTTLAILSKTLQNLNNYIKAGQNADRSKAILAFFFDVMKTLLSIRLFYYFKTIITDNMSYGYENDVASKINAYEVFRSPMNDGKFKASNFLEDLRNIFDKGSITNEEPMILGCSYAILFLGLLQCALSGIRDALSPAKSSIDDGQWRNKAKDWQNIDSKMALTA